LDGVPESASRRRNCSKAGRAELGDTFSSRYRDCVGREQGEGSSIDTPPRAHDRWKSGLLLSLVTAFLWGVVPVASKTALRAVDGVTLSWVRMTTAFVVLFPFLARGAHLSTALRAGVRTKVLLGAAAFFLGINYLLYQLGLSYTTPSNVQMVIQAQPFFLALGGVIFFGERLNRWQWVGFALLLGGMALFFADQLVLFATSRGAYVLGSMITLLAAAAWGGYAVVQKELSQSLHPQLVLLWIYGSCSVVYLPFVQFDRLAEATSVEGAAIAFASMITLVSYAAFAEATARWDATRVSAVLALSLLFTFFIVAACAALWPAIFEADEISLLGWVGAIAMVWGAALAALSRKH